MRKKTQAKSLAEIFGPPPRMNEKEYERYVANVISELRGLRRTKVFRNKRFRGVRQPGNYEIDISFEMTLSKRLKLLFIAECKNWQRPVDRPVVQKIAQTRDAISAHKAIVISARGFTEEAISVAENLGVALWVVSSGSFVTIMGFMGPSFRAVRQVQLKLDVIKLFFKDLPYRKSHCLMDYSRAWRDRVTSKARGRGKKKDRARNYFPTWIIQHGSAVPNQCYEPGVGRNTARHSLITYILRLLMLLKDIPAADRLLTEFQDVAKRYEVSYKDREDLIKAYASDIGARLPEEPKYDRELLRLISSRALERIYKTDSN